MNFQRFRHLANAALTSASLANLLLFRTARSPASIFLRFRALAKVDILVESPH